MFHDPIEEIPPTNPGSRKPPEGPPVNVWIMVGVVLLTIASIITIVMFLKALPVS